MDLPKVKDGQPLKIPADTYNAFVDAAIYTRAQTNPTRQKSRELPYAGDVILVKNVSGDSLDRFQAVAIGDPVILPDDNEDEFKNRIALQVSKPDGSEDDRWCVLLEGLPKGPDGSETNGSYGKALVVGVVNCKINLQDVGDTGCTVVADSYIPESNTNGPATILWIAGGVGTADDTGEQWAIIKLAGGGSLPVGEFDGMCYNMVSDNAAGWSFGRVVNVPPAYS